MPAPTFRKQERIVSLKLMETLFEKGSSHSVAAFPLRAIYTETERQAGCAPVQVLISVPKKRFKHAVDRNRVKRQVREAYRKHKEPVVEKIQEGSRNGSRVSSHKSQRRYEPAIPSDCKAIGLAHTILSVVHFPAVGALVQVYAHMQRICETGHPEARPDQRALSGHLANPEMQPLGRQRIRPRPLET